MATNTEFNVGVSTKRSGVDGRLALQEWIGKVAQIPQGQKVDAFWNNTTEVLPAGQASLVALYQADLLDCKGRSGSYKWYIGKSYVPFTRVRGVLSVFAWYLVFLTIFMPVLFEIKTQESYSIAMALSVLGFTGYLIKGFVNSTYRMLVRAVPGNASTWPFFIKVGLYHMGWMTCVVMFIMSYMGLNRGDLESQGYGFAISEIIPWLQGYASYYYSTLTNLGSGIWELIKVWFKYVGAFVVIAAVVGPTMTASDRPALNLLARYNQYDRYTRSGAQWVEKAGAGPMYAVLLSIYAGLHVMHPFFA